MEFFRTKRFSKELKRLSKKYRSLSGDLETFERVLEKMPKGNGSKHWNNLHRSVDGCVLIFKTRLACLALKGESLLRVVYACRMEEGVVVRIDYIELYYKGEQANENRELIEEYIKDCKVLF